MNGESNDDRLVREMVMTEIDVTNIKIVLKMIRDKIDVDEARDYLIEGGKSLDIEKLLAMVRAGSLEGAIKSS